MKGLGLGAAVFAAILSGCSSSPSTPPQVVDRTHGGSAGTPARPQTTAGQYQVQRGDTLYSIAFRFGWDWKALAARNNIPAPYTIRPGQRIRFDVPQQGSAPVVAQPSRPVVSTVPPQTASRPPVQTPAPVKTPTQAQPVTPAQPPVATAGGSATAGKVQPVQRSAQGWAWPANGLLIGKFSSNGSLNKGIDIAGELGQPVLAAADGSVVYAGSGLRGYGELVIIKHSDAYVSAYGHNRRLLVREGQQVKVGQHIAEMGSTGADRVKLHFEIRRQGKPVDPLQYLPRR
ncbi:peptidoglycan DD-metalloendopeptidase family protein [Pseudomonas sp. Gutcm_11s]|nr:peptidoglycan DD-metalloendopeptidase family protein [Pseudomonas sp. Gutcm_11s]MDD0841473.1 peptidoglycan DD-metalloendopeptidase family protein [Pseudomonas sp. Gutcm_11s]